MTLRPPIAILVLALAALPAPAQRLPDLGDASSASLSEQQEKTIGNRIMRDVRIDPAYLDDPEVSDYISSLGARLLSVADTPHPDIDYFVVQDDAINAFALVGGHIGVHTALIMLTQTESELAGVLGHETAHVLQKHQARMVHGASRTQWTSLAALALAVLAARGGGSQGGQVTEAAVATAGALQMQTQLDYTRDHEREADRVGLTLLERAGFDPSGMVTFFSRLLRANRLNEFKGMPSYLRTHPLTTERIADMQDRLQGVGIKMVPDSFEYRLARAKLRAMSGSATEAVTLFRTALEDQSVMRPREDVYGLAYALRRARDFEGAWKTLEPIRGGQAEARRLPVLGVALPPHPAFELLAAQLKADMHQEDEALSIYRAALRANPHHRGLAYGYVELLLQMGRIDEALADLEERLRYSQDDWRMHELQARAYARSNRPIAQHRAQAEAYYRRGNLAAAVDQLELAVKQTRGSNFYELSIAESRLRELRSQLENERAAEKALKIS
ncbi:MAG: M48 family metalloprotease [Usitatibacter sp.]